MRPATIYILSAAGALLIALFAVRLSADALGMAVGMVFGVLSGVPTALLVMAANQRRPDDDAERDEEQWQYQQHAATNSQPRLPQPYTRQDHIYRWAADLDRGVTFVAQNRQWIAQRRGAEFWVVSGVSKYSFLDALSATRFCNDRTDIRGWLMATTDIDGRIVSLHDQSIMGLVI